MYLLSGSPSKLTSLLTSYKIIQLFQLISSTDGLLNIVLIQEPTGSPNNVVGRAETSSSINITWAEITPSLTNGIIVSYKVQYERKDGLGTVQSLVVPHKTALITGLDEYVVYKIKVAGMTKKGVGVFSTFTEVRTKEDRKY